METTRRSQSRSLKEKTWPETPLMKKSEQEPLPLSFVISDPKSFKFKTLRIKAIRNAKMAQFFSLNLYGILSSQNL